MLFSATLGITLSLGGVVPTGAQALPSGASALNETHGDWRLSCMVTAEAPRCAISQTLVSEENRQRVLAIELQSAESVVDGVLILPFGLDLSRGAILAIDEAVPLAPLSISTCLPAGCIAPLTLDIEALSTMQSGSILDVEVVTADTGQEVLFSISLSGFTSAIDRMMELDG